jgi:hypothetical protein
MAVRPQEAADCSRHIVVNQEEINMIKRHRRGKVRLLKVGVVMSMMVLVATAGGGRAQEYETPSVTRNAATIFPAAVLTGPHYRVENTVISFGYQHQFTVTSDFGVFEVTGDAALRRLLREIHAIAELQKLKKGKEFAKALARAGTAPVHFAKDLIVQPVDTVTGIPKGLFRLFSNVGTALTTKKDPSQDSAAESILLMSARKREYAAQLGVDPYSSNAVLQKELNSVSWAAAVGGLTVTAALAPFSGPGVLALKASRFSDSLNDLLTQEPPARLRQINSKKLSAMGISKDLEKQFLDHAHFTPRHDTILVAALDELKDARSRDAFLTLTLSAQDEVDANFFTQMAETLRGYHETVASITEITAIPPMVLAKATNGSVLMPFPLDHGSWTERAANLIPQILANAKAAGFTEPYDLWVTGTLSPVARQQLRKLGITATENVDARLAFMD